MNNSLSKIFILIFCCLTQIACKTTKVKPPAPVATTARPMQDKSVQDLLFKVDSAQFNAKYISAKASVSTVQDGSETTFNINMRGKRDSVLWISITPLLGIEVARVLITTDSVKFIDRIHGKYQVGSFESINKILQLKANFELVQSLLFGNFFAYKKNENRFNSVYMEDQFYILSSLNKKKLKRSLEEKDPNKPVIQDVFIDENNYRILQTEVNDQKIEKTLSIVYSDFKTTDAGLFPFKSITKVLAEKEFEIKIEYGKLVVNETQEFPFNVPANYERIR